MNQKLETLRKQTSAPEASSQGSDLINEKQESSNRLRLRKHSGLIVPTSVILGFLLVIWFLFGDRLLPAQQVELVSVLVSELPISVEEQSIHQTNVGPGVRSNSNPLFQASGWIEANPFPYRASTLIGGFVEEVFRLEGEPVAKGEVIAKLVQDDALLDVRTAESSVAEARAKTEVALYGLQMAKAEALTLQAQIQAAKAKLAELDDVAQRMRVLSQGAVPEQEVAQALLRQKTQLAEVALCTKVGF